ncbi:MAG TPA: hypothetical protein VH575_14470 [Gemmataceae bacterium]|jgi:hypothetical protein
MTRRDRLQAVIDRRAARVEKWRQMLEVRHHRRDLQRVVNAVARLQAAKARRVVFATVGPTSR